MSRQSRLTARVVDARPAGPGYRCTIRFPDGKKMSGTTQFPVQTNQNVEMSVAGMISPEYYFTEKGRMYSFMTD